MDSTEIQPHIYQSQTNNSRLFTSKSKSCILYASSFLIVFLAISVGLANTNYYKFQDLKILGFFHLIPKSKQTLTQKASIDVPSRCVLWMAPFLSGGGYSSEAWSYILSLHEYNLKNPRFKLGIEQHGDLESFEFWDGLPQHVKNLAIELHQTECRMNETIVVCHSEPGAWNPPLFQTSPCPPTAYQNVLSVIGRTMFETDKVNLEHVKRCNRMDFVWVPTDFHVSTFTQSGVEPSKIVKIVQSVDINFFDPILYTPLDLDSISKLVLGPSNTKIEKPFVFLSVFKWEYRKGWDVLLKSYLTEFSDKDGVALYLLTNPYHSDNNFGNKIVDFVDNSMLEKRDHGWAPVYVIDSHIAQVDLPRLYKAANAFVLPSRGEGWGRPIVEAMAMALPVIATNWSGPTEYLTEENGYPLTVDNLSLVTVGPFLGHHWAEPCVDRLKGLMRYVVSNVEEGRVKGRKAREDMILRFSPEIVAGIVGDHIQSIFDRIG